MGYGLLGHNTSSRIPNGAACLSPVVLAAQLWQYSHFSREMVEEISKTMTIVKLKILTTTQRKLLNGHSVVVVIIITK